MGSFRVAAIPTAVAESVRSAKSTGIWIPGTQRSSGGARAVPPLSGVDQGKRRRAISFRLRPISRAGCAAIAWAGVRARAALRAAQWGRSVSRRISRAIVDVGCIRGRSRVGDGGAREWWRRTAGGRDAVRRSKGEIHSRAEYRGGLLFVSVGPGVKRGQDAQRGGKQIPPLHRRKTRSQRSTPFYPANILIPKGMSYRFARS
jgi:hypothetical protein